jgi:hypothetical protein
LPDADGPEFVALNGSFRTENRSLIGQNRTIDVSVELLQIGHSRLHRFRCRRLSALSADANLPAYRINQPVRIEGSAIFDNDSDIFDVRDARRGIALPGATGPVWCTFCR